MKGKKKPKTKKKDTYQTGVFGNTDNEKHAILNWFWIFEQLLKWWMVFRAISTNKRKWFGDFRNGFNAKRVNLRGGIGSKERERMVNGICRRKGGRERWNGRQCVLDRIMRNSKWNKWLGLIVVVDRNSQRLFARILHIKTLKTWLALGTLGTYSSLLTRIFHICIIWVTSLLKKKILGHIALTDWKCYLHRVWFHGF